MPDCDIAAHCRGLCRPHYIVAWRAGDLERYVALRGAPLEVKLAARIDTNGVDGCHRWTGRVHEGYPVLWHGGRYVQATHALWELATGESPPPGFRLRHSACGHAWCVNLHHTRPLVAQEGPDAVSRYLLAWNARHDRCAFGHALVGGNRIEVPGGISCRLCRQDAARARRR